MAQELNNHIPLLFSYELLEETVKHFKYNVLLSKQKHALKRYPTSFTHLAFFSGLATLGELSAHSGELIASLEGDGDFRDKGIAVAVPLQISAGTSAAFSISVTHILTSHKSRLRVYVQWNPATTILDSELLSKTTIHGPSQSNGN